MFHMVFFLKHMEVDQKIIDEIIEVCKTSCYPGKRLQKNLKFKHLNDYVLAWTSHLPDLPYTTRMYYAIHRYTEYLICAREECGNELRHDMRCHPLTGPISKHCCARCAQIDEKTIEQKKQRSIERHGCEYPQKTLEYRQKMSKKLKEMPQEHWDKALKKRQATCQKTYGVKNVSQVKEIKEKATQSFNDRSIEQKQRSIEKSKQTRKDRYGDENYCNSGKISKTKQEFSDEKNAIINDKRRQTVLMNYGVEHILQDINIVKKMTSKKLSDSYDYLIFRNADVEPLFSKEHFIEHPFDELQWRCKRCGNVFYAKRHEHHSANMYKLARCLRCYPLHGTASRTETQVYEFVKSIYDGKVIHNDRKTISPNELDIYVPNKKLAIEYNGIAWHSYEFDTPIDYHLKKIDLCQKQGIFLFHLFENEWIFNQDVAKRQIKHLIGHNREIHIDECTMNVVSVDEQKDFYAKNSLVAFEQLAIAYGLYENCILRFCIQVDVDANHFIVKNIVTELGIEIKDALSALCRYIANVHNINSIDILLDRRFYALSYLDSFDVVSSKNLELMPKYATNSNKKYLIDQLPNENKNKTYYTIYGVNNTLATIDLHSVK